MPIRLGERVTEPLQVLYAAQFNAELAVIQADHTPLMILPSVPASAFYGYRRESDQVLGSPVFDCWDGEITFLDQYSDPETRVSFYAQCFVRITYVQSQQWLAQQFEQARARYLAALAQVIAKTPLITVAASRFAHCIPARANSATEYDEGGVGFKFRTTLELRARVEEVA